MKTIHHFFAVIKDIRLIQISFDGNNNSDPPNLMNDDILKSVERKVMLNIVSYIDIIYTDVYEFQKCKINDKAVKTLESLS